MGRSKFSILKCIAGLSLALLATGCGGKKADETVAERTVERIVEQGLEEGSADVKITQNDQSVAITVTDETGQPSTMTMNITEAFAVMNVDSHEDALKMQWGGNAKIPDSFPADVPIYTQMKLQMVMEGPGQGYSVVGSTTDSHEDVVAFYKNACIEKGWSETTVVTHGGESAMLSYEKDGRTMVVVIGLEDGEVTISITTLAD